MKFVCDFPSLCNQYAVHFYYGPPGPGPGFHNSGMCCRCETHRLRLQVKKYVVSYEEYLILSVMVS